MNRRLPYLFLSAALLLAEFLFAQKQYNCIDWKTNSTVNTYLIQTMNRQYGQRTEELAKALRSKKGTELYVQTIRKRFRDLVGEFPAKCPLNAENTGTLHRDNYSIEKLIFQSFAHHYVTGNLYLPDGKKKSPAALMFCGRENTSKATESYQNTALLFAKKGFVVFVVDPICQSERFQLTDSRGRPLTRGGTTADGFVAVAALHVALFNHRISELNLYNTIETYKTILENPVHRDWYGDVVNKVLTYYDLADLVHMVGPGKLHYVSDNLKNNNKCYMYVNRYNLV